MEYIHVVDKYSIHTFYFKMKEKKVHKMCEPSSHLKLLFATEAYSMGTDAPNIRRIIHFGPPSSLESKVLLKIYCTLANSELPLFNKFKFVYSVLARGRKRRKGWDKVHRNSLL